MLIDRTVRKHIEDKMFKGKIIIVYGARQVGKTTLIRGIEARYEAQKPLYLNCDEPDIRELLTAKTSTQLKETIGNHKLIFVDEAQRVPDIGLTLKLIADTFSNIQVVATGSSSFELSSSISERVKYNLNNRIHVNAYFWRSHQQQEIDYLEDKGKLFSGFEMKWGTKRHRIPSVFLSTYKDSTIEKIDRKNFMHFVCPECN
jgi:energy-coupling factor transporter ATP-binding protein EcfA2